MPDPSARYGVPYLEKDRQKILKNDPTGIIQNLINGNRQSQTATNPLAGLEAARQRSKKRTSNNNNAVPDDILALQNMLGAYAGADPSDISQLQAELRKAIAGQFDPQIANTKQDMAGAKKRAAGAKQDIGAIYDDLVNYYESQVAPTKQRAQEAKETAANNASGVKESITNDYATRIRDQVDEFKRLGIQAAEPSATQAQDSDLANALAVADNTQAAENAALNQQAQGDLAYWTEGAGIAGREGAEQQSNITEQLNQFLNDQSQQLTLLKGQKSAAYHQGLFELQQQAANAASQQQNELWDRMLQLAQLKLSAARLGQDQADSGPGRGLSGALSFLNNQQLGDTFQQYLAESQRWATTPQAKAMYGGAVDTPEEWAQVMRDNAANKGQSSQNQQALWQAALRYFGRG